MGRNAREPDAVLADQRIGRFAPPLTACIAESSVAVPRPKAVRAALVDHIGAPFRRDDKKGAPASLECVSGSRRSRSMEMATGDASFPITSGRSTSTSALFLSRESAVGTSNIKRSVAK
jgi:hypothetical protein